MCQGSQWKSGYNGHQGAKAAILTSQLTILNSMTMRQKFFYLLIFVLLTSCAAPPPPATTVPTLTATAFPTETASPTSTVPAPSATPLPINLQPGMEVVFDESGDKPLTGTTYGDGETAILLANMSIGGQAQWDPFVAAVDKEKFTTITFDYRDMNDPAADIGLVLGWLREQGFGRVICLGASMGTRACSSVMGEPEIVGIALIAGSVHHASVAAASYPKLFVAGEHDVWAFNIQEGYEQAAEPRELLVFQDNRAHGTDLFQSEDSDQFLAALLGFVNPLAIR